MVIVAILAGVAIGIMTRVVAMRRRRETVNTTQESYDREFERIAQRLRQSS